MKDYLTLADYPTDTVQLACERCDRRGRYRKERLISEHGADMRRVAWLAHEVAAWQAARMRRRQPQPAAAE
jgi:hypothetical protein